MEQKHVLKEYEAIQIWSADWQVSCGEQEFTFTDEVTKKIPLVLLIRDEHFMGRVISKLPNKFVKAPDFKKALRVKINYKKQLGTVNSITNYEN